MKQAIHQQVVLNSKLLLLLHLVIQYYKHPLPVISDQTLNYRPNRKMITLFNLLKRIHQLLSHHQWRILL